jgi:hypothetical protein
MSCQIGTTSRSTPTTLFMELFFLFFREKEKKKAHHKKQQSGKLQTTENTAGKIKKEPV